MNSASDVQTLLFGGHGKLIHSLMLGLELRDPPIARQRIGSSVVSRVSLGFSETPRHTAVHLMISQSGLRKIGVPPEGLDRPYVQGITQEHRSRALGDVGPNDPSGWQWSDRECDVVLMIYAGSAEALTRETDSIENALGDAVTVRHRLSTYLPADRKEPFGFRDGIVVLRLDAPDAKGRGEVLPASELLAPEKHPAAEDSTYIVLRQLEQDVDGFWKFWREQGKDETEAVWLAAKAVGRWPNGMPVTGSTPVPQPELNEDVVNATMSFASDLQGDNCPIGAHIRRAHPRDGLMADTVKSAALTAARRLTRRGRAYGSDGEPRGLLFLGLCADLARQFEFVQNTWLNNTRHAGLSGEADPVASGAVCLGNQGHFTIPRDPLRRRVHGVPQFVTVRGGGYFLLPGRKALARLFPD